MYENYLIDSLSYAMWLPTIMPKARTYTSGGIVNKVCLLLSKLKPKPSLSCLTFSREIFPSSWPQGVAPGAGMLGLE